jgi:serine protease Do
MKFKKTKKETWKMIIRIIVLSVILGGVSGIFTAALTTNYLADYAIELADYTQPLHFNDQKPRAFPESYQEALSRVQEEVVPGVVTFFDKSNISELSTYSFEQAEGQGVVLTSDGWIVTTLEFSRAFSHYEVLVQGELYGVEQIVEDEVTGVSFVKVLANNFPVVSFGNGWDAQIGDQIFIIPTQDAVVQTAVMQILRKDELVVSSDEPTRFVQTERFALDETIGSPVANLSGELIGLCVSYEGGEYQTYLSLESILPSFASLLENGEITRAMLGAEVINLFSVIGLGEELVRGYEYGALLSGYSAGSVQSAAQEAGLEPGDIILSVDGLMVDRNHSLDEYLSTYKIGDEVTLNVDHDGVREDVRVTLH